LRAVLAAAPLSPPLFSFCPLILAFSPRGGRREQKARGREGNETEGKKATRQRERKPLLPLRKRPQELKPLCLEEREKARFFASSSFLPR